MQWFKKALYNYADFSGRAHRTEFWYFMLFYILLMIAASFVDGILGTVFWNGRAGLFSLGTQLVLLVPYLAVGTRRLHDTDRSGWWLLLHFVPLLGLVLLSAIWSKFFRRFWYVLKVYQDPFNIFDYIDTSSLSCSYDRS